MCNGIVADLCFNIQAMASVPACGALDLPWWRWDSMHGSVSLLIDGYTPLTCYSRYLRVHLASPWRHRNSLAFADRSEMAFRISRGVPLYLGHVWEFLPHCDSIARWPDLECCPDDARRLLPIDLSPLCFRAPLGQSGEHDS